MDEILLLKIAVGGLGVVCIILLWDWVRLKRLENKYFRYRNEK